MTTLIRLHGVKTYTFVNVWPATDFARDLHSIRSNQTYVEKRVLISGETVRFMSVPGDALAYAFPKPPNNGWASLVAPEEFPQRHTLHSFIEGGVSRLKVNLGSKLAKWEQRHNGPSDKSEAVARE